MLYGVKLGETACHIDHKRTVGGVGGVLYSTKLDLTLAKEKRGGSRTVGAASFIPEEDGKTALCYIYLIRFSTDAKIVVVLEGDGSVALSLFCRWAERFPRSFAR